MINIKWVLSKHILCKYLQISLLWIFHTSGSYLNKRKCVFFGIPESSFQKVCSVLKGMDTYLGEDSVQIGLLKQTTLQKEIDV